MIHSIKNQFIFFYPYYNAKNNFIIQDKQLVHQLSTVLRQKIGSYIVLLDGKGNKLLCKILNIDKQSVYCEPMKEEYTKPEEFSIHLIIGTPKKEALKDILKYTTQLGISSIKLVDMEFSQIKNQIYQSKQSYWQSIFVESLEQSKRAYLPYLSYHTSIQELILSIKDTILVADIAQSSPLPLLSQIFPQNQKDIYLMIGPEGGFSSKEREFFTTQNHLKSFTLTPYILRVETAVISSLVSVQTILASQTLK